MKGSARPKGVNITMQNEEVKVDGDQNKPAEVPAPAPEEPKKDPPAAPPADTPSPEPTKEELKAALDAATTALEAAEGEIVRLKKEPKTGGGENDDAIGELNEKIATLTAEIEAIKAGTVSKPENNKVLEELQQSRKKLTELGEALISKNTKGTGTGTGTNQDQPTVPAPQPHMSDADKSLMERVRQRRIREGRDPESGLKK